MSKTLLSLFLMVPALLPAATIMSTTTPTQGVIGGQSVAAGFNLSSTWNNVLIRMDLATNNGSGSSVTAFLTSTIGLGATNIVPSAVIGVPAGAGTQTLFSLPTLGPGDYYFSIQPADGLTGPLGGGAPAPINLGAGVTSLGLYTLSGGAPTGTPAQITFGLRFEVTGDPDTAVPEPGTWGMLLAGGVVVAAWRRKGR